MAYQFETVKLEKGMYSEAGRSFSEVLEKCDPSEHYKGTSLEQLDAYQRQLKRFDIKVSGAASDVVSKFFASWESAVLFPEYVARAVRQGIDYQRSMAVHKVPFGRYVLQSLGLTRRVLRGEGAFVGEGAYEEFRKLASVFYQEGAGVLIHPVWQGTRAHFVALSLLQEPRADYVAYAFTFWEDYEGYATGLRKVTAPAAPAGSPAKSGGGVGQQYHTVVSGDTLWAISGRYGLSLDALLALNPQIKNPNRIAVGQRVRVA